jgi:hypothetical protein
MARPTAERLFSGEWRGVSVPSIYYLVKALQLAVIWKFVWQISPVSHSVFSTAHYWPICWAKRSGEHNCWCCCLAHIDIVIMSAQYVPVWHWFKVCSCQNCACLSTLLPECYPPDQADVPFHIITCMLPARPSWYSNTQSADLWLPMKVLHVKSVLWQRR